MAPGADDTDGPRVSGAVEMESREKRFDTSQDHQSAVSAQPPMEAGLPKSLS